MGVGVRLARAGVAAAVGGGALAAVVFAGTGHPVQDPELLSGAAWLPSTGVGQLTLLDGASAEVAAQVRVAKAGNTVEVVQQGPNAYAVNQTRGTIRRVDGATFQLTPPSTPIPDADSGLTALAGPQHLYALDTNRGVLVDTAPDTLAPRGEPQSLATKLSAGAAALDGRGTLWVHDDTTGMLTRIAAGGRTLMPAARPGSGGRLTLANGNPVLVSPGARTVTALDPASGAPSSTLSLDLRDDDTVEISGSPHAARVYAVTSRGVLTICDLDASSCERIVPLDAADNTLGPAVEAGNRVFIPDYTTGHVWIVDLSTSKVVANPEVLAPAGEFQLINHDGVVFFNDPDTERAGVIRLDGDVVKIAKYDPDNPNKGLTNPNVQGEENPDKGKTTKKDPDKDPKQQPDADPDSPPGPAPPDQTPPGPNQPGPNQPGPQPGPGPSTPPTSTPKPPGEDPTLEITLSDTAPRANQNVTLRVRTDDGQTPTDVVWDLGDGTTGTGDTVTHAWTEARTYQVGVRGTVDGREGSTSLSVDVVIGKSTVPDVVGQAETEARNQLQNANLEASVTQVASNTVAAGAVIDQSPDGGTEVDAGSTVDLTVSSGPHAINIQEMSPSAAWETGAGTIPFNGSDVDERGFALFREGPYSFGSSGDCKLEDGSAPKYLETHPQWVSSGWIQGTYTLPSPVIPGDHFRARIGFIRCDNLHSTPSNHLGDVEFVVIAINPGGGASEVYRQRDTGANLVMHDVDVDLSAQAGATQLRLRVDRTPDSQQAWASWVNPRIEG